MKKIILSLFLLLTLKAGFSTIMFTTQYNTTLNVFEVYVTSTVAYANFQQGPSTVSILFESGYDITSVVVNTSYNGGPWVAQDKGVITVAGPVNGYKFIAFLSNGAAYPIVPANSPVKLFSFSFTPSSANCAGGFKQRQVVNTSDPLDPDGLGTYDITAFLFSPSTGFLNSTNTDLTFQNCAALTPLAVHFLSFIASKNGNNALLKWDVTNEDPSTSHYDIERSINRIDFKTTSRVDAKKNGSTSNSYEITDNDLSSLRSSGVIYYRIKQIDSDNHFVYSEIKIIRINGRASDVSLYPNPAKAYSNVIIELEVPSQIILSISDAAGRKVQNMEFAGYKGLNQKRIDLSKLAGGSYMIKVNNGSEIQTISLVKE